MVEMALIMPFLVLITMGIIEMGYYIYSYSVLENAARRASEAASRTNDSSATCLNLARSEAIRGATLTSLQNSNITFTFPDTSNGVGDRVEANIVYTGNYLTPIGRRFFGSTFTFRFTSRRTITSTSAPLGYKNDCTQ